MNTLAQRKALSVDVRFSKSISAIQPLDAQRLRCNAGGKIPKHHRSPESLSLHHPQISEGLTFPGQDLASMCLLTPTLAASIKSVFARGQSRKQRILLLSLHPSARITLSTASSKGINLDSEMHLTYLPKFSIMWKELIGINVDQFRGGSWRIAN